MAQFEPGNARRQIALRIGAASDRSEREADGIAHRVNRPGTATPPGITAAHGPTAGTCAPPEVLDTVRRSGRPLSGPTRRLMESRIGHDFGRVRIHADPAAARSAAHVGARAYTVGQDVVFGAGGFAEHTPAGRELLAHELAHVAQQRHAPSPWLQRQPAVGPRSAAEEQDEPTNTWPFAGATAERVASYVDTNATGVAVNLVSGRLLVGVGGQSASLSVPLGDVDSSDPEILPLWPEQDSRAAAATLAAEWRDVATSTGHEPVAVYRGPGGLLWPTRITPRTTPRIWSVYPAALASARTDVGATRDTFVDLLFWYVGARMPVRTAPEAPPPAPRTATSATIAADVIAGFTAQETAVIREAQGILSSSEFAAIRAAHQAGETTSVTIGGRLIQYEAEFTYAEAMTLGQEGFVMGPRAFADEAEVAKTLLHELHRLHTSTVVATGSANATTAAQTTRSAFEFAEAAWRLLMP
ncbi:MAG: DUF4157 domain-containing protein [Planctomycetes bacterium]|nr:DUF4157 domain-containing protein [Planctomycetota bacterium]